MYAVECLFKSMNGKEEMEFEMNELTSMMIENHFVLGCVICLFIPFRFNITWIS